ncbi:MAG: DEAD/DEAH box helicase [Verrucomicrobiales bacterium]
MATIPTFPLLRRLHPDGVVSKTPLNISTDEILNRFLSYVEEKGLNLYPAQEEAVLELLDNKNVILNTPTGSGKSLVAAALHFQSLARGQRSVYTCPIKALVNEKFLSLCRDFGPENVGMATGDATVNRDAPILCCTAEILSNIALRHGADSPFHDIIMDEFHYYSDRDRGVAWQIPLLTLSKSRFLLMSATLGETALFEKDLTRLTGRPTTVIKGVQRPVPLEFAYDDMPLEPTVEKLISENKAPIYIVHFTQLECSETAQNLTSINFCTREEKEKLASAMEGTKFNSPYGPEIKKFLRHGIGLHHAGLLPKYRVLVEQLAQQGMLKVICGTDTLGVGVNVPIRTVLLTRLTKYDGEKSGHLTSRDFHQITGRAGRKGFDDQGWVIGQAPEHDIENARQERKSAGDAKKQKKMVKKRPPEGFVNWSKETFFKLVNSSPEPLVSRFKITHAMLLNVLSRGPEGCAAMQQLVHDCHEQPITKKKLRARGFELLRSLLDRKILEFATDARTNRKFLRLNVELQDEFSMDESLSLYLIDTIKLIDPASPNYALDVLTLVESVVENPDMILRKQLDKIKSAKMAELKNDGMPFEERLLELEKLEYPKPNRDFVYSTFNEFTARHPWVGQENIRPKSVVREMYESFFSFADYIRQYDLQKTEGVLLRYLMNVFKVLEQTVPVEAKTEELQEVETYLSAMIAQVDSSLMDEWEKMRNPEAVAAIAARPETEAPRQSEAPDITRNERRFTSMVRNQVFSILRALATHNYTAAFESLSDKADADGKLWTADSLRRSMEPYYLEHERVLLDAEARNLRHTYLSKPGSQTWTLNQTLVDPEGHNDWSLDFEINLLLSREEGAPDLKLLKIGPIAK